MLDDECPVAMIAFAIDEKLTFKKFFESFVVPVIYIDTDAPEGPIVVLKVPKFEKNYPFIPRHIEGQLILVSEMSWMYAKATAAAGKLANVVAGGKLVIDLSQNSGGAPALAGMMIYQLTGIDQYQLCAWYDNKAVTGGPLDWIAKNIVNKPLPDLSGSFTQEQYDVFMARTKKLFYIQPLHKCLVNGDFSHPKTEEDKKWMNFKFRECVLNVPETLMPNRLPFNGWSPYQSGLPAYHNHSTEPESISYFTEPAKHKRGGKEVLMTKKWKGLEGLGGLCADYELYSSDVSESQDVGPINIDSNKLPAHVDTVSDLLTSITVITDGTCGSTCSNFVSELYLNNLATVVTYGGIQGLPMDISSFNGGNVVPWLNMQQSMLQNQLLGQIIFNITGELPSQEEMPEPFLNPPLFSNLKFAFSEHYIKGFGPGALPREWYEVPGSYHADWWPEYYSDVSSVRKSFATKDQEDLYRLAASYAPKCVYEVLGKDTKCGYVQLPPSFYGSETCGTDDELIQVASTAAPAENRGQEHQHQHQSEIRTPAEVALSENSITNQHSTLVPSVGVLLVLAVVAALLLFGFFIVRARRQTEFGTTIDDQQRQQFRSVSM